MSNLLSISLSIPNKKNLNTR